MIAKKLLSIILSVCLTVSVFSSVLQYIAYAQDTEAQTYGYDNIFDSSKDIKVAYLGGSITEGAGGTAQTRYSTTSMAYFKNLKAKQGRTATEINAGIGGTPSDLGLYRLYNQILSQKPDVVFVEFAVNDRNRGEEAAKNMEGIVRMCMDAQHQPCVIFVISAYIDFDLIDSMATRYKTIADYYNVGFIDFNGYMKQLVSEGKAVWDKSQSGTLTGDNTHPNSEGHVMYGNYIANQLENDNENTLKKLTYRAESLNSYVYGEPKMIAHDDPSIKYTGDWMVSYTGNVNSNARTSQSFLNYPRFTNGYHEYKTSTAMSPAPTIEYTFTGRSIGLFASRGDSGASATYILDEGTANEKTGTISNYYKHGVNDSEDITNTPVGSQMTCCTWLLEGLPYGEHTLKITLAEPTNNANYIQNLFSFGYFMVDDVQPAQKPTATNIVISGRQKTGQTLTGSYTFKNVGDLSVSEGTSSFRWLRSSSKYTGYEPISGASSLSYTTTAYDAKKYIKLEITPVNANGLEGVKVYSDPILIRDAASVSSKITVDTAKLGNINLSTVENDAPVIEVSEAISSKFAISGSIEDFGYAITLESFDVSDNSKYIAYAQMPSGDEDGSFEFSMKPSKKIEPGKTYIVRIGGKNVTEIKQYYFKTAKMNTEKEYNVSANAVGGTIYCISHSEDWNVGKTQAYSMDTTISLKANPDDGNKFLYWKDSDSGKIISTDAEYTFKAGSGKKLTATFSNNSNGYFVTFRDMNNKILYSGYTSDTIIVPNNSYIMGYTFAGWSLDNKIDSNIISGTVLDTSSLTGDALYKAAYTLNETLYNVETAGALQEGGSYKYNTLVSLTPSGESGKVFAYWTKDGVIVSYDTNYKFFVTGSCRIEAVHLSEAVESSVIVTMSQPVLVSGNKIAFFAERNVPDEFNLIESGILIGNKANLTLSDYSYKAVSTSSLKQGQFTVRKANVVSGETWYGVAYVIYEKDGTIYEKYSSSVFYDVE